jgi:hypothetical protein
MSTPSSLLWRAATRTHDWTDLAMPSRAIAAWAAMQLITPAEWVEGVSGRRRKVAIPVEKLVETLAKQPKGPDGRIVLRAGGSDPEWALTAFIFPRATGMSLFNLTVAYTRALPASQLLAESFVELYTPSGVDAAYIHTDPHWTLLAGGTYKPPLVTTPTFAGVFWANHLSGGHLAEFSIPELRKIEAHRTEWQNDGALSVIATPTLEDALTSEGEADLVDLTHQFQRAKLS